MYYEKKIQELIKNTNDYLKFNDLDGIIEITYLENIEASCKIVDQYDEFRHFNITYMDKQFNSKDIIQFQMEGSAPYYIEASVELLVQLII